MIPCLSPWMLSSWGGLCPFIPPLIWVGFLSHSLSLQQLSEGNLEPLRYREVSQWYLIYSFPYPTCEISQLFFPDGLNASHPVRLHNGELLKNCNNETSLVLFIQRVKPKLVAVLSSLLYPGMKHQHTKHSSALFLKAVSSQQTPATRKDLIPTFCDSQSHGWKSAVTHLEWFV